jgi:hypothetical protein
MRKLIDDIFNDPKFKDKMSNFELFTGVITDVDYNSNVATVDTGVTTYTDVIINQPQANLYVENNVKKIFGAFQNFTSGAFILGVHLKRLQKRFLIVSFPTFSPDQYQLFYKELKKGINRLPIKYSDRRDYDTTNKQDLLDTEIIKWGEYLTYSSGAAAVFLDYIGNILLESTKEIHFKIGDRDSTTKKINNSEVEVVVGRVLKDDSSAGAIEDTTLNSKNTKIKIDINSISGNTVTNKLNITANADGDLIIKNPNTEIRVNADGTIYLGEASLQKMVLGESLKSYIDNTIASTFNSHMHPYIIPLIPIATGPTTPTTSPITPEVTPYLSDKNKNK